MSHVTRTPLSRSKGQRSRSLGRFTHRHVVNVVGASGSCSGGRGNVLAVRNCCYVAVCSAWRGASAPTGEGHIVAATRLQLLYLSRSAYGRRDGHVSYSSITSCLGQGLMEQHYPQGCQRAKTPSSSPGHQVKPTVKGKSYLT